MEPARAESAAAVNRWQLHFKQNPNTIWENGIAYDPRTKRVIFHGGHIASLYPQSTYTFLYDLAQNRFFEAQTPNRPQRQCLINFDYLDGCRRFITCNGAVEHGSVRMGEVFGGDYKAVKRKGQAGPWLYDSVADRWEACRTLPPRWPGDRLFASATYEFSSDVVATLCDEQLLLFCPRTNRITFRPLPEALRNRISCGLGADPARHKLIVFGGHGSGPMNWARPDSRFPSPEKVYEEWVRRDTWIYDLPADRWHRCKTELTPPAGMPGFAMLSPQLAYHNPSGQVLLLVNGTDRYERDPAKWGPSELWSFDAGREQWTRLNVENPLPFAGLMEYAPEEDLLIVFGGGRDGVVSEADKFDFGVTISPACSRQVWSCRLAIPGQSAPPVVPQRLTVRTSDSSVSVSWPEGGAHQVLRAEVDSFGLPGPYRPVASGVQSAFTDTGVAAGRIYAYQVIGDRGTPSLPGFNQPFRPSRLRASVDRPSQVTLRWMANEEPDVAGYHVYRADGPELERAEGKRLTTEATARPQFVDRAVNLSDGLIRSYWVTAVNRLGVESGPSPLAYTVPDAPESFTTLEGLGTADPLGYKKGWLISWQWPEEQVIAGFNVYHADRHMNTHAVPGGYDAFEKLWTRLNAEPLRATELIYKMPKDGPANHYFYVRAVNTLGQEGFCTDILSPTDRQFRP